MIDLNTGETYTPVITLVMIVVIVVALAIALNLRKKIEKNEDRGGLLFTPEKLRIVPGEESEPEEEIYEENPGSGEESDEAEEKAEESDDG